MTKLIEWLLEYIMLIDKHYRKGVISSEEYAICEDLHTEVKAAYEKYKSRIEKFR